MSEYLHGTDVLVGYNVPDTSWYQIATPGRILAEMDTVLAEAKSLDADIQEHKSGDPGYPAFKRAWSGFFDAYKKFYDEHKGWFGRMSASTINKAIDNGRQLNEWRTKFQKFGGVPGAPDPTPERRFPLASILYGVIVVGAVGATGYALSKAGVFAKLVRR